MANNKNQETTVIKKYANRRLYNTGTSTYVTLEDLAEMVKRGEDFSVQDARSGDDLTHSVLTQIVFELENRNGETMLPVSVLRQLISFYGDQMQALVPSYLEHTMSAFTKEQERMREQMAALFDPTSVNEALKSGNPMKIMEEQTRRNMEMFSQAMRMMTPFGPMATEEKGAKPARPASDDATDLGSLREQIAQMQRKLDDIGRG